MATRLYACLRAPSQPDASMTVDPPHSRMVAPALQEYSVWISVDDQPLPVYSIEAKGSKS